jgi:hypothetical protein
MYIAKSSRLCCRRSCVDLRAIAISLSSILPTQMLHYGDTLTWYLTGPFDHNVDLAVMNSTRPLVDADGLVGMPLGPVYERRLIRSLLSMAAKDKRVLFKMLRWLLLSMDYST